MMSRGSILCLLLLLSVHMVTPLAGVHQGKKMAKIKELIDRIERIISTGVAARHSLDLGSGEHGILVQSPSGATDVQKPPVLQLQVNFTEPDHRKPAGVRPVKTNSKRIKGSGCFGRRIERIGSLSGLGCNYSKYRPRKQ
ncbi:natriuretic peptides B-like [Protopterus annectens]|uniref:natriuretic peptides B-like n=1 Tax=Protopterus annectens TaxID=7888 RepID=UPI001CFA1043|nr:natriuretic peptides B-like [Protopterus annectens]